MEIIDKIREVRSKFIDGKSDAKHALWEIFEFALFTDDASLDLKEANDRKIYDYIISKVESIKSCVRPYHDSASTGNDNFGIIIRDLEEIEYQVERLRPL